jgi:hypothetical protein
MLWGIWSRGIVMHTIPAWSMTDTEASIIVQAASGLEQTGSFKDADATRFVHLGALGIPATPTRRTPVFLPVPKDWLLPNDAMPIPYSLMAMGTKALFQLEQRRVSGQ